MNSHAFRLSLALLAGAVGMNAIAPRAGAQDRAAQERLQSAARIECSFPNLARGRWEEDSAGFVVEDDDFEATFFDIDIESGTAESEGRFGDTFIVVRYAEGYLHFMQTQRAGPIYLTTVLADLTETGRFKAVHTRHEYTDVSLPGWTSRPEMYIGTCSVHEPPKEDPAEDSASE